jgi:hypothetical protein
MTTYYNGELPEEVRRHIPNFNQLQKVIVNYTPDQKGQDIRPQDIVRPINRKWATLDEMRRCWGQLTNAGAPTYGSCTLCFRSGPIGRPCNQCNYPNTFYIALNYTNQLKTWVTLDSVTMSEIFHAGHETAKADRDILWLRTPSENFTMQILHGRLHRMYDNKEGEDAAANTAEKKRILREITAMIILTNDRTWT